MNWLVKIPSVEINTWAQNTSWERLLNLWQHTGIDGIVVPVSLSDQLDGLFDRAQTVFDMAHQRNMQRWLIFPVLNNPIFYYRHPESRPVHRLEESFSFPNWFAPICPSDAQYHIYFEESVFRLMKRLHVDVIILDYLRTPYFWEKWGNDVDKNQWPPYCYCAKCKIKFEEKYNFNPEDLNLPDWLNWQGSILSDWLVQIRKQIIEIRPGVKIGIQLLPLLGKNKKELCCEWIGQNLHNFEQHVDFFSPLIYERLLSWNHDEILFLLIDLMVKQKLPIVPSFQISSIKWDRKTENESNLGELMNRIQPLGIKESTVFHARDLLTEKAIRSQFGD